MYRATKDEIARRDAETGALIFLATACALQVILGRRYVVENSAYSDIFSQSPLSSLRGSEHHLALFDQCSCGPTENGEFFRKRTHFQSSHPLHHLHKLCPGDHVHTHLRGEGRAASTAKYPFKECELLLQEVTTVHDGGRITLPSSFPSSKISVAKK